MAGASALRNAAGPDEPVYFGVPLCGKGEPAAVTLKSVEALRVEPRLVREVEHAAPLDPVERFDLGDERGPVVGAEPVQLRRRPPEELRQLEDRERALLGARRRGRLDPLA